MPQHRVVTVAELERRCAEYEDRYGVPSSRLVDAFRVDGELIETSDFHAWSMLWTTIEHLRRRRV